MASTSQISAELIEKYDGPVPRYTSYPTALQFHDGFKQSHYQKHAEHANARLLPKNLSIYVHVPFCQSMCYFCGCNKIITQASNNRVENYLERLIAEIGMRAPLFSDDRLVTQIHFGGGTPNFLSNEQLAQILQQIATHFHLDIPSNLELSIEIDPRTINSAGIEQLASLGFSRFSIGVQDFSNEVQLAVNRVQDEEETLAAISTAMRLSDSVNVDLITGLPKQTLNSFSETLDRVIETGVTRVAAYNFAYLPQQIKAQRLINEADLPSPAERLELTALVARKLTEAGYRHIGMDHYALPTDSLSLALENNTLQRNFQGYTTHKDTDLVGLGASSISKFDSAYAQNHTQLSDYNQAIDEGRLPIAKGVELNDDDRVCAAIIQQIMCRQEVDLEQPVGRFLDRVNNLTLRKYFRNEIENLSQFEDDGLLKFTDHGFSLTPLGRYFMRPIAATFDRYQQSELSFSHSKKQVVSFSKAL